MAITSKQLFDDIILPVEHSPHRLIETYNRFYNSHYSFLFRLLKDIVYLMRTVSKEFDIYSLYKDTTNDSFRYRNAWELIYYIYETEKDKEYFSDNIYNGLDLGELEDKINHLYILHFTKKTNIILNLLPYIDNTFLSEVTPDMEGYDKLSYEDLTEKCCFMFDNEFKPHVYYISDFKKYYDWIKDIIMEFLMNNNTEDN